MTKNWTGNTNSIFKTLGASQHTESDRAEYDYYATEPKAVELLVDLSDFNTKIWEPACGEGHISKVLNQNGYVVRSTDLVDRGFGEGGVDFLQCQKPFDGDIITNPPYSLAKEFVLKALSLVPEGNKVAMFLKVTFVEGKGRKELFQKYPPHTIFVSSSRLNCGKNGDFEGLRTTGGSAVAYAWFIWVKGFTGTTSLKWFN